MKQFDIENVQEDIGFDRPPAGGYVVQINAVEDDTTKECLILEVDIDRGKYDGFYSHLYDSAGFWGLKMFVSYKDKDQGRFKAFIKNIEAANTGYEWKWDEQSLVEKKIGAVLRESEYRANDGTIKSSMKVYYNTSVENIETGNFKIPAPKLLESANTSKAVVDKSVKNMDQVDTDEIPF